MAGTDNSGGNGQRAGRRASVWRFAAANTATLWFALVAGGMVLLLGGLGVDAYRHNHSSSDESLLSLANPGHLIAIVGVALASVSALMGLYVAALRDAETRPALLRRGAAVSAALVALVAVGAVSVTYIAATGASISTHNQNSTSVVSSTGGGTTSAPDPEAVGIAQGLQQNGLLSTSGSGSGAAPASTPAASPTMTMNMKDAGKQPTFTQIETMTDKQLLPLFPAGTMTLADIPKFRGQLEQARAAAQKYTGVAAAKAAGYVNTTSDVPYMGEHYINYDILRSGKFDPAKPTGLLYSKIGPNGAEELVGLWYLMLPGINGVTVTQQPVNTWAGNLAMWHGHPGLCLVGTKSASENETAESCTAKGGAFTADLKWMLHVWVAPGQENANGVLSYLNADLFAKQQAAGNTGAPITQQNGTIPR
ncbi:MAG: hypothetical protein IVW36_09300 [Dehalococcoidia bacterium]|nr:hypothetical protein [Dehalococcoidia bacterium]